MEMDDYELAKDIFDEVMAPYGDRHDHSAQP